MAAPVPAKVWHRRIRAFKKGLYGRVKDTRKKFRDALSLRFFDDESDWNGAADNFKLHSVNYSYRYISWFQASATGEEPVIKSPRDGEGDEVFAEMVDRLLLRVVKEAGAMKQLRDVIPELGWLGCSSMWYGFHARLLTREAAVAASQSSIDVVDAATMDGDETVLPDQDHDSIQALLRERARAQVDPEEAVRLRALAQEHDLAEEERVESQIETHVVDHHIWTRLGRVGIDTFWDHTVVDVDDADWMVQRVLLDVEEAQNHPALKKSLRMKLKGMPLSKDKEREGGGSDSEDADDRRVELFIAWDKRNRRRHYLSPEMETKYLEVDDKNPYVDDEGRELIPGFFPCEIFNPLRPPVYDPIRTLATPLIAPGWPQQLEANQLRTMSIARAKRHSARNYIMHPLFKGPSAAAIRSWLSAGLDGGVWNAPAGTEGVDLRKLIVPIEFGNDNGEITVQEAKVEADWIKVMGMPYAELTSVATAETATQESIGIAAGKNQAEDVIKQIEATFARVCEGIRGLVRGFYPIERIAGLVGRRYTDPKVNMETGEEEPSILDRWRVSSLEGDALQVRFGVRAKSDDAVRTKQIMEGIAVAREEIEPTTGLPRIETLHAVQELFAGPLDLGKAREVDPNLEAMRQKIVGLAQEVERLEEEKKQLKEMAQMEVKAARLKNQTGGGGGSSSPKPGSRKTPSKQNLNAGARRGTSSASA